ncbi:MAG: hypothetical protein WCW44_02940 [archaeon]|jgi:hypothetical protein
MKIKTKQIDEKVIKNKKRLPSMKTLLKAGAIGAIMGIVTAIWRNDESK